MKRAIVGSAAAALLMALIVVAAIAPTPRDAPVGPTQEDLNRFAQQMLDKTWESTGLPGERPIVEAGELRMPTADSYSSDFADCMNVSGVESFGWSTGRDTGYTLSMIDGDENPGDTAQLMWYLCVAEHPIDSSMLFMLRTPSQRAARYDYQLEHIAPCLTLLGYDVTVPPSREEAIAQDAEGVPWSAYDAVWSVAQSQTAYEEAVPLCGDPELLP